MEVQEQLDQKEADFEAELKPLREEAQRVGREAEVRY